MINHSKQLLDNFASLSHQAINNLDSESIKALLFQFHTQINQQQSHTSPQNNKTKGILKVSSKSAYKRYIRNNIRSLVRRTVFQTRKQKPLCQTMADSRDNLRNSGLSKIQKVCCKQKQLKLKNFYDYMGRSIEQNSNNDQLSCPICLQVLVYPTLTTCGHVFCFRCLDESLLFSNYCPNCRQNIKGFQLISCRLLQAIIDKKCQEISTCSLQQNGQSNESQSNYSKRKAEFKEWKQKRCLNYDSLAINQIVDVRDTQNIWCQGTITNIYHKEVDNTGKTQISSVLVHYNRWHKLYNEIIQVPTIRLAPLNCFSSRNDIPRYHLSDDQDNMRGTVTNGARAEQNPDIVIQIVESEQEEEQEEEQDSNPQSLEQIEEQDDVQNQSNQGSPPYNHFGFDLMSLYRNQNFFPVGPSFWHERQVDQHQINENSRQVFQVGRAQIPRLFNNQSNHYLFRHAHHYDDRYQELSSTSVREVLNQQQPIQNKRNFIVLDIQSSERKQHSIIEIKDSNQEQKDNESQSSPKKIASLPKSYLTETE